MTKFSKNTFTSLDRKLSLFILILGSLLAILVTSINAYFIYQQEKSLAEEDAKYIQSSFIGPLSLSMWNLDDDHAKILVKGMLGIKYIEKIELYDQKELRISEHKDSYHQETLSARSYPLIYENKGRSENLGEIVIYINANYILNRTIALIFKHFIVQLITVFITSFVLMILFRKLVTQYLEKITNYFGDYPIVNTNTPLLTLDKVDFRKDEIDVLETSINSFITSTQKNQTQIIELKTKAEEANRVKNIFLANISHELRTPLNSIIGIIEVLNEANEQDFKNYLAVQKKAGQQLMNLVNDILDLTKMEAQEFHLHREIFSITNCIASCISLLELSFKEKKNIIEFTHSPDFPAIIWGDESRISQVVLNLLTNANKFTNEGLITVSLYLHDTNYAISVKDSGIGISQDKMKDIFEPFRQDKNSLWMNKRGFGIGLSVAKKITEALGGKIEVSSTVDVGSEFIIYLPYQTAEQEESLLKPHKIDPSSNISENLDNSKLKILMVDDTEDNLILLGAYLKNSGHELHYAENGEVAVQKCMSDSFDLVLMDIQMPIKDGFEATKEIRFHEEQHNKSPTPIVALSAYQQKTEIDKALQAGCTEYLFKPIQKKELIACIGRYNPK